MCCVKYVSFTIEKLHSSHWTKSITNYRERKRLNSLLRWCVREICDHRDGACFLRRAWLVFLVWWGRDIVLFNPWLVFQQFPNCVNQLKGLLCFSWTLEFPWFIHCCFLRAILWPKLLCTYVFLVYHINRYLFSSSHQAGMKQASPVTLSATRLQYISWLNLQQCLHFRRV